MNFLAPELKESRQARRRGKSAGSRLEAEIRSVVPGDVTNFQTFRLPSLLDIPEATKTSIMSAPSPLSLRIEEFFAHKGASETTKTLERLQKLIQSRSDDAELVEELNAVVESIKNIELEMIDKVEELENRVISDVLSESTKQGSVTKAELVAEWVSKNFASSVADDDVDGFPASPCSQSPKSASSELVLEFRRQSSNALLRSNSPKYEIAMIFSERYKVTHPQLNILASCNEWDFDIFQLGTVSDGKPLSMLMGYLYHTLKFEKLNIDESTFLSFMSVVENGYNAVPYHNRYHAADVVQSMLYFIVKTSLSSMISEEDAFAGLLAAAVHDLGHRGMNNQFEIESESGLAIRYNDQSVLENHHAASAFRLMQVPDLNILMNWNRKQRKAFRDVVLKMVLGTDMKSHFHHVATLQTAIETHKKSGTWFDFKNAKDRELLMVCAVHSADICNPCRSPDYASQWTKRLEEEWFAQGDSERSLGLPVSPMMDRSNPNTAESQVGFITYIVEPLFKVWTTAVTGADECLSGLEKNLAFWKQKIQDKKSNEEKKS